MKLLVSIKSLAEAEKIKKADFDILDIKNPAEGSLGANYPGVIKSIRDEYSGFPISAAGGDLPGQSGIASQVSFALASLKVDYIKLGLYGFKNIETAVLMLKEAEKAVKLSGNKIKLIAAAYADYKENNTINPLYLNEIAFKTEIDGIMIDTLNKSGKNLFDFLKLGELKRFAEQAKKAEVFSALAGSLKSEDLPILREIDPDIIGFRGAVCENKDRTAAISSAKINSLYQKINK
ncbi:MAG: (5-formylfuran-3-yl)methyl phosphate synthase [Halanaerobium sp.]